MVIQRSFMNTSMFTSGGLYEPPDERPDVHNRGLLRLLRVRKSFATAPPYEPDAFVRRFVIKNKHEGKCSEDTSLPVSVNPYG